MMMAGRWDATVTVVRGGQRLGTKQLRSSRGDATKEQAHAEIFGIPTVGS